MSRQRNTAPKRLAHRIGGRAEPAEIEAFNQQISAVQGDEWKSFSLQAQQGAFETFEKEYMRMLRQGRWGDGNHGSFFVMAVNSIIDGLGGAKKSGLRLMSMDPLATYFILLDPGRNDPALNGAIMNVFRSGGIKYCGRDEAKQAYLANFEAACADASVEASAAETSRSKIFSLVNSATPDALKEAIAQAYNEHKAGCCGAGTQARFCTYDSLRMTLFNKHCELFPALTPEGNAQNIDTVQTAQQRIRSLQAAVDAELNSDGAPGTVQPGTVPHSRDKICGMQFVSTDLFCYVPTNSGATVTIAEIQQSAGKGPLRINACLKGRFNEIF